MRKRILIGLFAGLITYLSCSSITFAAPCNASTKLMTAITQKACKNIVSLISIDLSLLSPKAAAADVHTCACMPKANNCCKKSMLPTEEQEAGIVPASNMQITNPNPNSTPTTNEVNQQVSRTNLFRIDLFRIIKFQIQ